VTKQKFEADVVLKALSRNDRHWFDLAGRGGIYLRRSKMVLKNEERHGLHIVNVGVSEEYRRQGVFSSAVGVVEEAAAHMNVGYVFVETILNPVLVPALKKLGYTVVRRNHAPIVIDGNTFHSMRETVEAYKFINIGGSQYAATT
jgi:GNAT superfamily N-acetyltransferase